MRVLLVKYNAGNVRSVQFCLERLGIKAIISDDEREIQKADKVIFPGVGEASSAMRYLRERGLDSVLANLRQPVLGICLGLQLLCKTSEENDTECIGIYPHCVLRFEANSEQSIKVPHMGWNSVSDLKGPLFSGIGQGEYFYFVHSFYAELGPSTAASCIHGAPFSAALERDNFFSVQFHPERSAAAGEIVMRNFINL